jgi:hypothetical protein
MIKVTSYILSKQLAEAGFEAETNYIYAWSGDDHQLLCFSNPVEIDHEKDILGYDLETILEALPYSIEKDGFEYFLSANQFVIAYLEENHCESDLCDEIKKQNESLADCAARLLLLLVEKGLLTFKK